MLTIYKKIFLTTGLLVSIVPVYTHASETLASSTPPKDTSVLASDEQAVNFTSCSQDAIEKRDNALAQSRTEYNATMNTALLSRKEAEKKAVAITNEKEKKVAIKNSVEDYKTSTKQAQNTLTSARKAIWNTFDDDITTCRETYEAMSIDSHSEKQESVQEQKHFGSSFIDSIKSIFSSKEN